jgi:hypothetical protein
MKGLTSSQRPVKTETKNLSTHNRASSFSFYLLAVFLDVACPVSIV